MILLVNIIPDSAEEHVGLQCHHSALLSKWQDYGYWGLSEAPPSPITTTCTIWSLSVHLRALVSPGRLIFTWAE